MVWFRWLEEDRIAPRRQQIKDRLPPHQFGAGSKHEDAKIYSAVCASEGRKYASRRVYKPSCIAQHVAQFSSTPVPFAPRSLTSRRSLVRRKEPQARGGCGSLHASVSLGVTTRWTQGESSGCAA